MAKQGHNKPILTKSPLIVNTSGVPNLKQSDFDKAVFNYGYECFLEKSVFCPCRNRATGMPLPNCCNCMGTGWIFVEKKDTRLVIQGINKNTKFKDWTEDDMGNVSVSARNIDRLSFMDRITVNNIEVTHNQVLRTRTAGDGTIFAFLYYFPLYITHLYLFNGVTNKLEYLEIDTHYTIEGNKIVFDPSLVSYYSINRSKPSDNGEFLTISVRYRHHPQYCVIDIPREASRNRESDCETGNLVLDNLPVNAIARKTHFLIDEPDFTGESVFDNTFYGEPASYLGEPTDTLQYHIERSSAEQIAEALTIMNNPTKLADLINLIC